VSDLDLFSRAAEFVSLDDSLDGMALPDSAVHIARENRHRQIGGTSVMEQTYAEGGFRQIAGNSAALKSALADVERVAPTNATVLLLGETGDCTTRHIQWFWKCRYRLKYQSTPESFTHNGRPFG
jgi:transcriptional regulator of aromatic amino acid metabolism